MINDDYNKKELVDKPEVVKEVNTCKLVITPRGNKRYVSDIKAFLASQGFSSKKQAQDAGWVL